MRNNIKTLRAVVASDPRTSFGDFMASPVDAEATFSVDAAGRDGVGGFGVDGKGWARAFHLEWPVGMSMDDADTSSALQELLAVYLTVATYGHLFKRINIWSDSQAAVLALAKGFSTRPLPNIVIRDILLLAQRVGVVVLVMWHSRDGSSSAIAADSLSRGMFLQARARVSSLSTSSLTTLTPQDFPIFGKLLRDTSPKHVQRQQQSAR